VIQAFREDLRHDEVRCADTANLTMARMVFVARALFSSRGPQNEKARDAMAVDLKCHRTAIGHRLVEAQLKGSLSARQQVRPIIASLVRPYKTRVYATTNWDATIDDIVKSVDPGAGVSHIHGLSHKLGSLYLPSEIVDEPYREHEAGFPNADRLRQSHSRLMAHIEEAKRLVVYGLSFDPLDAELSMIVGRLGGDSNIRHVDIVDLNPDRVEKRLRVILDGSTRGEVTYHWHSPGA